MSPRHIGSQQAFLRRVGNPLIERIRQSTKSSFSAGFDAAQYTGGRSRFGDESDGPAERGPLLDQRAGDEVECVRYSIERDRFHRLAVTVVLNYQGFQVSGAHSGPAEVHLRDLVIAKATLKALSHLPARMGRKDQNLTLHGVKEVKAVGRCFVLVAVQSVQDRETKTLAGATQVEDSRDLAVIRATIQAVDRRIRSLY